MAAHSMTEPNIAAVVAELREKLAAAQQEHPIPVHITDANCLICRADDVLSSGWPEYLPAILDELEATSELLAAAQNGERNWEREYTSARAEAAALRKALGDCLHVIGNQWIRWVRDIERWPELKRLALEAGSEPHPEITSDERQFIYGYRAYRAGADLLNGPDDAAIASQASQGGE